MAGSLQVKQDSLPSGATDNTYTGGVASRMGPQVIMDFYTWAMLSGCGYQVKAGTLATPLVGDIAITTVVGEYCVDAASGYTLMPTASNISIQLAVSLAQVMAIKSVLGASSAGTAFTPLPLRTASKSGGTPTAAVSTARVAAAGGVTVTVEAATTTRRHWSWANPTGNTTAGTNLGIYAYPQLHWEPLRPPVLVAGPTGVCCYVQIADATVGPSYFGSLDYLEFVTANLL